jgi:putative RNA 2'-phosphotransferase
VPEDMTDRDKQISKTMAYLLRHGAIKRKLKIDVNGWVIIEDLIQKINEINPKLNINFSDVERVVANNSKQRFAVEYNFIRASQGHSLNIELNLEPQEPPIILYHGTYNSPQVLKKIEAVGLLKMNRQYVHLSSTIKTAIEVGSRRGKPILFEIFAEKMFLDGIKFYISQNKVWLVDSVPPKYLRKLINPEP